MATTTPPSLETQVGQCSLPTATLRLVFRPFPPLKLRYGGGFSQLPPSLINTTSPCRRPKHETGCDNTTKTRWARGWRAVTTRGDGPMAAHPQKWYVCKFQYIYFTLMILPPVPATSTNLPCSQRKMEEVSPIARSQCRRFWPTPLSCFERGRAFCPTTPHQQFLFFGATLL